MSFSVPDRGEPTGVQTMTATPPLRRRLPRFVGRAKRDGRAEDFAQEDRTAKTLTCESPDRDRRGRGAGLRLPLDGAVPPSLERGNVCLDVLETTLHVAANAFLFAFDV